jgi:outer membrane protein OmpA-like peptidoglycan-associated protein
MLNRVLMTAAFLALASLGIGAQPVAAQGVGGLVKKVKSAAEDEATRQVQRRVRDAVACAFDDPRCIEEAKEAGEPVVLTDREGNVIEDEDGNPITDPGAAEAAIQKPGEGVWANYDFVPGETVLYYEDYENDRVGDFPRRMEFMRGNWEIVEWQGQRLLRNTGPRHAALKIVLPRELPESFTIELSAHFTHSNHRMVIATTPPEPGASWNTLEGNFLALGVAHGTGVGTNVRGGIESTNRSNEVGEGVVPIRIMVDGRYAKVYVGERRTANVPNAEFARSSEIFIENIYSGSDENPLYLGAIRIAEGGRDLYDQLEAEGSVATRGILFDVDSDRIRPESTPTLEEIGRMLEDHPELRISIVGHTDSDGDDSHNADLSERRANAVREYMIQTYGIDAGRLESEGKGESEPVADNGTPEGKQQNRRVELIRLG